MKNTLAIPLTLCLVICAPAFAGPPKPVAYRDIPDSADDAQRHITVKAADRGPVWLYTGFLNNWHPEMSHEFIARVKPNHWRYGLWPFWTSSTITANPRPQWGDMRDSPEQLGQFMDAMMRLQADGMTGQMIFHHKGPYYGRWNIKGDALKDYYDHIYTLVKYCRMMGAPFDYYEITNEPPEPHNTAENPGGYGPWRGTWQDFLGMWDTAYDAVRAAYPQAKIVGPSFGSCTAATIEHFLAHCKEMGQTLDVLSWHEISQGKVVFGQDYRGTAVVEPDKAHKNIMDVRRLVEAKYRDLKIQEYHIDEWGYTVEHTGPGTQIAYFYYFDQAGVDRAAKAHWTQDDLDGILVSPRTPRTSYWAWAEYAKQKDGVRLVTQTNDRCVVALASRHDDDKIVRAVIARSKRDTGEDFSKTRPPVKTVVDFQGILLDRAEVTIVKLGPKDGPLWEEDLAALATQQVRAVSAGKLTLRFDRHEENQVYAVTVAPIGTWASEAKANARRLTNQRASEMAGESALLPHLVFKEDFEIGFESGKSILGKRGWTHAKNKSSYLTAFEDKAAHRGQWSAQFQDNYWSNHTVFHPIAVSHEGVIEATAWFRFPDYKGNADGHGLGAMNIGLFENADRDVERNYISFKFGTHEQNGYSVVIFNNDGVRRVAYTEPSGVRHDVRGKWHQIGVVLDYDARTLTCRHRDDDAKPWQVFLHRKLDAINWTPKFLYISGYNQAPDWRFRVDDIEVRSNIKPD